MDLVAHLNVDCHSLSSGVVVRPFRLPRRRGALLVCEQRRGGKDSPEFMWTVTTTCVVTVWTMWHVR